MAYDSTIPKATDVISQSQQPIQNNFAALAPFGNGYADFTVQSINAPIVSTDTGLFTKSYTATGSIVANNEMFIQTQVNGNMSQKIFPMTASTLSNTAASSNLAGWTYLPSGLLLKWGSVASSGILSPTSINADMTSGGPAYTNIFSVQLTPNCTGAAAVVSVVFFSIVTTTDVRGYLTAHSNGVNKINYFMIGN